MSYRENVEQAAVALKRGEDANWELARLTFENTYESGDVGSQSDRVSMVRWCEDIRNSAEIPFSVGTGVRYRAMWLRFGSLRRQDRPSWVDAYAEFRGSEPEYQRGGRTPADVISATPDVKRAAFQQLARDPDVIQEAAMLGTPTSRAVSDLYTKTERVREEFRERETESDPISKRLDQVEAALDIEAICGRFAAETDRFSREIAEALARTGPANERHLYWVRSAIERAEEQLAQTKTYVETGRTDMDAFLQDVLGGR